MENTKNDLKVLVENDPVDGELRNDSSYAWKYFFLY